MKAKHRVKHQRLEAEMEHGSVPDVQKRLARAFDLILRAAKRSKEDTSTEEGADHLKKEKEQ